MRTAVRDREVAEPAHEPRTAPAHHPAGGAHRHRLRPVPRPGRAAARHRDEGDGGRRSDDLRGRRRLHPAPVRDDRRPRPPRRGRDRARHLLLRDRGGRRHGGLRAGARHPDRDRVPGGGGLLDGLGDHRHVRRREGERPDGCRGPPQPRRGRPGRDARRGRLRLPRGLPVAPRRLPDVRGVRRPEPGDRGPGPVPHRRLRLRRQLRGPLRPAGRRHLHEGRRRRRRPRRQGRGP